ncbi:MAG: glycogen debranching enzyme, partial [Acidimicrobiales bacterium]
PRGVVDAGRRPDIGWFRPDGAEMTQEDWEVGYAKSLCVYLNGRAIQEPDRHGRPVSDKSFFLVFNGWDQEQDVVLPAKEWGAGWGVAIDTTSDRFPRRPGPAYAPNDRLAVVGHHFLVLQEMVDDEDGGTPPRYP